MTTLAGDEVVQTSSMDHSFTTLPDPAIYPYTGDWTRFHDYRAFLVSLEGNIDGIPLPTLFDKLDNVAKSQYQHKFIDRVRRKSTQQQPPLPDTSDEFKREFGDLLTTMEPYELQLAAEMIYPESLEGTVPELNGLNRSTALQTVAQWIQVIGMEKFAVMAGDENTVSQIASMVSRGQQTEIKEEEKHTGDIKLTPKLKYITKLVATRSEWSSLAFEKLFLRNYLLQQSHVEFSGRCGLQVLQRFIRKVKFEEIQAHGVNKDIKSTTSEIKTKEDDILTKMENINLDYASNKSSKMVESAQKELKQLKDEWNGLVMQRATLIQQHEEINRWIQETRSSRASHIDQYSSVSMNMGCNYHEALFKGNESILKMLFVKFAEYIIDICVKERDITILDYIINNATILRASSPQLLLFISDICWILQKFPDFSEFTAKEWNQKKGELLSATKHEIVQIAEWWKQCSDRNETSK